MKKTKDVLIDFRKRESLTVAQLAEKIGISQTFLTKLENEQKKLSERLFGELKKILSESEIKQIESYENYIKTPDSVKIELEELRKTVLKNNIKMITIPLYSSVSAGIGYIPDAEPIDYISIPEINGDVVAIVVKGDSMEPTFSENDLIVMKKDEELNLGDIGVFFDSESKKCIVKRLKYKNGTYILASDNPAFGNKQIDSKNIKIFGKVINIIKKNLKKKTVDPLIEKLDKLDSQQRQMLESMLDGIIGKNHDKS